MEYIQCTNCKKRYAATESIKLTEGQFTACQSCKENFLIMIQDDATDSPNTENLSATSGQGWDPSLTMPTVESEDLAKGQPSFEKGLDDDANQVLAILQKKRKKQQQQYMLAGLLCCLLAITLWFGFEDEKSDIGQAIMQPKQTTAAEIEAVAKVQDANSTECRQEAAKQWLIDYQAMHEDYTADEFVRILKRSHAQVEKVQAVCKSKSITKDIISTATAQEMPGWFSAEIRALQKNRKR